MDSYTNFAYVYDTFMDQEPYEDWADRVCGFLNAYGLPVAQAGKVPDMEDRAIISPAAEKPCGADGAASAAVKAGPAEVSPAAEKPYGADGAASASVKAGPAEVGPSAAGGPAVDERKIVVDLGCGTGKLTEILAGRGYDMIGIDLSEDMLAIAQERKNRSGSDILYSLQDMREFELYGAAGAMVSVGDSINYLLEVPDLEKLFACVRRGLLPGGVFVFDFKTVHLYRDVIGDRTIAEDRGDCAFIWDNWYDPETCINEYDLAIFAAESGEDPEKDGSLFRRFNEVHRQRGYTADQLRQAAAKAGLEWIAMQDADQGGEVNVETERVMAAVRKPAESR